MGRAPRSSGSSGLKKGPWTAEEDQKLKEYIEQHGPRNWRTLPENAGLQRCGKSCRLRWTNYLRPDIKRGRFSFEEEEAIIQLHSVLGNKWSAIAARLPGRTDNEIKNYWNTHIRKRLLRMGLDPVTHAPRLDHLLGSSSQLNNLMFLLNNQEQQQQQQMVMNPQLLNIVLSTLLSLNQTQNQTGDLSEDQFRSYSSSFHQNSSSVDDLSGLGYSQMLPPLVDETAASGSCFGSLNNNNQQVSTESTPFTSYTSSPLDSSYISNGFSAEDEMDSFLNFEIPEDFNISELLD